MVSSLKCIAHKGRQAVAERQRRYPMQVTEKNRSSSSTDQTERRWSYTNGTSDTPLLGLTIGDMFDQTVEKFPDHPALISRQQNIRLTYRELQAQVNQCAKGLLHMGFQKGQRIG